MKNKEELINDSKQYFENYKDAEVLYATGDGNFFLEKNQSDAKSYANTKGLKLVTIAREDAIDKPTKTAVIIPEGEPSEKWTKDQLIAYAKREFDLTIGKSTLEANILAKIAEAAKAKADAVPTADDEGSKEVDIKVLREEYEKLAEKKAFNGWNVEQLQEKIKELKAAAAE